VQKSKSYAEQIEEKRARDKVRVISRSSRKKLDERRLRVRE
jgi:hypothetical protein